MDCTSVQPGREAKRGPFLPAGFAPEDYLEHVQWEKDVLQHEVFRCHEQLGLVFELTEHISNLTEPDVIEDSLLRRFAAVLGADSVFIDRGGCCLRVAVPGGDGNGPRPEHVRDVLAAQVEAVRDSGRALAVQEAMKLDGASTLLGTLVCGDEEPAVVVAIRNSHQPAFDANDILAAESALALGAQVLHNTQMVRNLQRFAVETVCTLVNAIDAKDDYTSDHSERVGSFARMVGEALGLPKAQLQAVEWSALLHDIGKIGIPGQILNKPGPLTTAEFELMKGHSQIGYDVLKPMARFDSMLDAVRFHHESHDGSGYPCGLAGHEIPLAARIIHVVDTFDALTTDRPYRAAYGIEQAFSVLEDGSGKATDAELTSLFIATLRDYMARQPNEFRARFGHLNWTAGMDDVGVVRQPADQSDMGRATLVSTRLADLNGA